IKTVDNYRVGEVAKTLKEAMTSDYKGLKVIIAEGECQLERQRKLKPVVAEKMKKGERHVRVKYGVDEDTCTGDHSCIRLSGCPTLTVKDNPDPLRNYPARGAVTWKSIVGTNVAADALSYLASAGVMGGTLIVLGEDYGEGGVVAQERSHAFALKSLMWLLDPRPNLPKIVEMVERGFELSEVSNSPVMMELRIRACHVQGSFASKNNVAPAVSTRLKLDGPPKEFIYDRLAHPPAIFRQEKLKSEVRLPAARKFILEN